MKSYKIRSLIYFGCFVAAAVVYYNIEQNEFFQNSILSSQVVDVEPEENQEKENEEDKALH